uniref:Immunoglobulin domain-containing protein n=1 Tax=Mastacembelus armatus TaxID=205130 RepID=A0A3Q3M534_9TELE
FKSTGLPFIQTAYRNAKTTITCDYPGNKYSSRVKFFCKVKGSTLNTAQQNTRRFSMKDDTTKANITVTIRNMRLDDTGTYWCGAESTDPGRSDKFFNRLSLTSTSAPASSTQSTSAPASSTQSTSAAAESQGETVQEKQHYAEIQELPQKPNSGTALKTVSATANFPTHPSASILYSKVILPTCSAEVKGDTYCTVTGNGQSSACSTVNQPSRLSEDHL